MERIDPKTIKEWQGLKFRVERPLANYRLLSVTDTLGDLKYQQAVGRIDSLNRKAIDLIDKIGLAQFANTHPVFTVVIVPEQYFVCVTGIPINYSEWATVCSRSVWNPHQKEDAVITSSKHSIKMDFPIDDHDELSESQLDVFREAIHEHLPTVKDYYFPYDQASVLPLSEAIDETVPYYILDLGRRMPKFTEFRANLRVDDILTVRNLWDGFSGCSSNPVATNKAYGSVLLLGLGINRRLEVKYGLTKSGALSKWIDIMSKASVSRGVVELLAEAIKIDEQALWDSKDIQKEGQDILRREYI